MIVVCVNGALMDTHQIELASELDASNYSKYSTKLQHINSMFNVVLSIAITIKDYPKF